MKAFYVTLLLCFVATNGQTTNEDCPKPSRRFNATTWIDKFGAQLAPTGVYRSIYFNSPQSTTDLPATYLPGVHRSFMIHLTITFKHDTIAYWHKFPSDVILHFYNGYALKIYIINKDTGLLEVFPFNRRTVLFHVPPETYFAMKFPKSTPKKYAFFGFTIAPGIYPTDIVFPKQGIFEEENTKKNVKLIQSMYKPE